MEHIILIKDAKNVVLTHRVQTPSTSGKTHSEGPSILAEPIEMLNVTIDVEGGYFRDKRMNIACEGAMGASILASGTTFHHYHIGFYCWSAL